MSSEHFKYLKELDDFRKEVKESLEDTFILSLSPLNCQAFVQIWNRVDKWNKECIVKIQTNTKVYKHKFDIDSMREGKVPLQDLALEGCIKLIHDILKEVTVTETIHLGLTR